MTETDKEEISILLGRDGDLAAGKAWMDEFDFIIEDVVKRTSSKFEKQGAEIDHELLDDLKQLLQFAFQPVAEDIGGVMADYFSGVRKGEQWKSTAKKLEKHLQRLILVNHKPEGNAN